MWSANRCRSSRGLRLMRAFDTNALQFEPYLVGQPRRLPAGEAPALQRFEDGHCAHSSNAAGSPRKCARTSPAKCSEPVIRIGFGFARESISASRIVGLMKIVGQPRRLPAGEAPALQKGRMFARISANASGEAARWLRILGRKTESAIGASASQMPRKFLSDRTARTSVAF